MPRCSGANRDIYAKCKWFYKNHYDDVIAMLTRFCDGKKNFIRDFAFPYRRLCKDVWQLWKQIVYFGFEKKKSCYLSIYGFSDDVGDGLDRGYNRQMLPDYEKPIINKLWLETDMYHGEGSSKDKAVYTLEDTLNTAFAIDDYWDKTCLIIFSGNKGFHVYKMLGQELTKKELVNEQWAVVNEIETNPDIIDTEYLGGGEVTRVFKIPFTVSHKTGRVCIPVTRDMGIDDVLAKSLRMPSVRDLELVKFR